MSQSRPKQLKAVLFDMDGTLVSSLPVIHYCVNWISKKYVNQNLTVEQIINSFGPPAHAIIRNLTGTLDKPTQDRAVKEYYECYGSNVAGKAIIFPGISDLLSTARKSGLRLALVTGVEKTLMDYTLDAFGLSSYFEARICRDDVARGKPDPEGVNLALAHLALKNAEEALLIGDAPADMSAGKRAGVLTGAALWSPENIGDPRSVHPDFEFRTVEQLARFLFKT